MSHLIFGGVGWCEADGDEDAEVVEDPRDATCVECLRRAASYGAAAAMRCAAVEGLGDAELKQERDFAIRQLNKIERALHAVGYFMCASCGVMTSNADAGMLVPVRLCNGCVAA